MCNFLSIIADQSDRIFYANWNMRTSSTGPDKDFDSHAVLDELYRSCSSEYGSRNIFSEGPYKGLKGHLMEEKLNAYEYNPWTDTFEVDSKTFKSSDAMVAKKVREIDMNTVCPYFDWSQKISQANIEPKSVDAKQIIRLYNWSVVWHCCNVYQYNITPQHSCMSSMRRTLKEAITSKIELGDVYQNHRNRLCSAAINGCISGFMTFPDMEQHNRRVLGETVLDRLIGIPYDTNVFIPIRDLFLDGLIPERDVDSHGIHWRLLTLSGRCVAAYIQPELACIAIYKYEQIRQDYATGRKEKNEPNT